ncbi:MAG TPA: sensor histidine kinase [Symbiobacteriaceae bacterium]|nr:sensor histidine kinase [Symbiobacteriaceae bacterium]
MRVPVENAAQMIWGALLIIYLLGAGRLEFRTWPVALVFGLSGAAAVLELPLRRREWRALHFYDSIIWTVLLAAMVAVTGGRSSESWPAYIMMSLTAPALGRPVLHYGLLGLNAAVYAAIYAVVNPDGVPAVPALVALRIGLFFLVTYVVDRSMERERAAHRGRVAELVNARDAERRRIAGEVHDWLGAGIVAPMRKLELSLRTADPTAAAAKVREAAEALRRSTGELRRIMEQLHPHLLEQMGVTEALQAYCTAWEAEQGLTVTFEGGGAVVSEPPPNVALAAYRICQEALNNIAGHAQARTVHVNLSVQEKSLVLIIEDEGQGFAKARPGGRGLQGMKERAETCGGTLAVRSVPGHGTTVTATLKWS